MATTWSDSDGFRSEIREKESLISISWVEKAQRK